jgi:hypothetical protein
VALIRGPVDALMTAFELRCVSIVLLIAMLIAPASARQKEDFASLEKEAERALRPATELFAQQAELVARLQSGSERAPDANQRARLALLWLRSMRSLLTAISSVGWNEQPYRNWLDRHETVVTYSEPAGQWLIVPEVVWRVHDAHKSAPSSEAIAWFAVENGYPGECEGYVPCYANIMNWLDGEYLRRHPRGSHASEAVEQVHSSLTESVKRLSDADAKRYFNPASDCGDLKAGLVPLRQAIDNSNADRRTAAVSVIDELLARCR